MKKSLLSIVVLMFSIVAFAVDGNHYNYVPKSPEAAAFDRVPDIPVSNYTGSMSFSIPIYTLECGDITLPITLDYQGNAIPVRQEATWVGLNWLLNAGGAVVTRIGGNSDYDGGAKYKEDWNNLTRNLRFYQFHVDGGEFYNMSYKINGAHPDWCGDYGKTWFTQVYGEDGPERNSHGDLAFNLYREIFNNDSGETPTFHASFLGNSITFVWDKLRREFFITGRKQNFRIEGTPTNVTIIDGKGIAYTFATVEFASIDGSDVDMSRINKDATLYLSYIKSPSGHVINFKYVDGGEIKPVYSVNEVLYDRNFPTSLENYTGMLKHELNSKWLYIRRLSHYYTIRSKRLSEISTDQGTKIRFNVSSSPRLDLNGTSYALDNIMVSQTSPNGENVVKRIRFGLGYFGKNTVGGNTVYELFRDTNNQDAYTRWFGTADFMYSRLRLDSVWEENPQSKRETINKYKFAYHDGLPCKASAAVDYWGYFNGAENLKGTYHVLIPRSWDEKSDAAVYDAKFREGFVGADRRPNANYVAAGMLRTITYPTGGRGNIQYEPNSFTNYLYFDSENNTTRKSFGSVRIYRANQPGYSQDGSSREGDSLFSIKYPGKYTVQVSYYKSNLYKKAYWRELMGHPLLVYQIESVKENNGGEHEQVTECTAVSLSAADTLKENSVQIMKDIQLKQGKCKLEIWGALNKENARDAFYEICASIDKVEEPFETKGAGVRVKEISMEESSGTVLRKNFEYVNSDNSPSGVLMSPQIFAREKMLLHQTNEAYIDANGAAGSIPAPRQIQYWQVSSDCLSPNPAIVGYGRVAVKNSGNNVNVGEHVYNYWNQQWGLIDYMKFCKRIEDPRNGLVTSEEIYDTSRNLVRLVENSYKFTCVDSRWLSVVIDNIYRGPNAIVGIVNPYCDALQTGCMQIYLYPSAQFSMLSSSSKLTEYSGGIRQIAQRDVLYNQTNGLDSVVINTQSERGDKLLEETLYPSDVVSQSINQTLSDKHINEVPVENLSSITNEEGTHVAADTRYEYSSSGSVSAEYQWKSNVNVERGNFLTLKDSYGFSSFDKTAILAYNNGNKPRMVQENGGDIVVYLWGYSNQYPIAVVRGADFSSVSALLGGSSAIDNLESAMCPTLDDMALYERLCSLKGCEVTTYSYSPLVGMITMVTPNGERTSYTYDAFCRLSSVLDHEGIVSSAIKYNFKR